MFTVQQSRLQDEIPPLRLCESSWYIEYYLDTIVLTSAGMSDRMKEPHEAAKSGFKLLDQSREVPPLVDAIFCLLFKSLPIDDAARRDQKVKLVGNWCWWTF